MMDNALRRALKSEAPYLLAVHRQNTESGRFYITRTVYVPMRFADQDWGQVELSYILEDEAWPKA